MSTTKYIVDNKSGQTINNESILRPYKVYTALLTQSGGSNLLVTNYITQVPLIVGVTYFIVESAGCDFTIVGAPNNNPGTSFVATGTTPLWGDVEGNLEYNTGAPVVTVLENTIGNIWFSYHNVGQYYLNSDVSFTLNKTVYFITSTDALDYFNVYMNNQFIFVSVFTSNLNNIWSDELLFNTPIEIRIYN